jgi:hypothetical protein
MMLADEKWRIIIGALEIVPTQPSNGYCQCIPFGTFYPTTVSASTPWACQSFAQNSSGSGSSYYSCNWISQPTFTKVRKPSDGVVLAESAENFPGTIHNSLMTNTAHFQARNNEQTREKLLGLWNGAIAQGEYLLDED